MLHDFSSLFTYQTFEVKGCDIVFSEITLLQDFHTYKGIYTKGTEFAEATVTIPTLLLTFYHDDLYISYITEVQINMRLEPDL